MGRVVGSTNKQPPRVPETVQMTTEQKIEFLANLIVDRILEDQKTGKKILRRIRRGRNVSGTIAAA
jgi:hypothetical protein